jgi:hypothetical protein
MISNSRNGKAYWRGRDEDNIIKNVGHVLKSYPSRIKNCSAIYPYLDKQ